MTVAATSDSTAPAAAPAATDAPAAPAAAPAASAAPAAAPAAAAAPVDAAALAAAPAAVPAVATTEETVPESYTFTAPEGVKFDDKVMASFGDAAKELKLSQDAASKLVGKVAPVIAAQQTAAFEAMKTAWATEATALPEIGGEKLPETLAIAERGIKAYFGPKFNDFLKATGLGNHPEMIKGFHKIGLTVKGDTIEGGRQSDGAPKDARSFFPNSNMNA